MNPKPLLLSLFLLTTCTVIKAQTPFVSGIGNSSSTGTASVSLVCDTVFSFPTVDTWPGGITSDGNFIYNNGNTKHFIYKHDFAGVLIDSIPNPFVQGNNQPGGDMDFDGTNLLMFAEQSDTLYKIDPVSGAVVNSFEVAPCTFDCYGVAFDGTDIWISDYSSYSIYKIDANTGAVLKTIVMPTTSYVLPIKFINGHLYGLGIFPGQVFEIDTASGNILSIEPWCLGYSIGFCKINNNIWGTSSQISNGGTQRIYKFESLALGNDYDISAASPPEIFPNPSTGKFKIALFEATEQVSVEIVNNVGKSVYKKGFNNEPELEINLKNISPGIYIIKVNNNTYHYSQKLVIYQD